MLTESQQKTLDGIVDEDEKEKTKEIYEFRNLLFDKVSEAISQTDKKGVSVGTFFIALACLVLDIRRWGYDSGQDPEEIEESLEAFIADIRIGKVQLLEAEVEEHQSEGTVGDA